MHVRLVRVRCRGSGLPCRQLSFTERPRSSTELPDPSAVPSDSSVPSANPATVTVSPPELSAIEIPSGSGSLVRPFWFSIARCAAEPNGFICPKLSTNCDITKIRNASVPMTRACRCASGKKLWRPSLQRIEPSEKKVIKTNPFLEKPPAIGCHQRSILQH